MRLRKTRIALSAAFLAVAAGGMAGCGDEEEERRFYCTSDDGTVVDEDRCDDDGDGHGGSYFLWHGPASGGSYRPGERVPVGSGQRFPYNDTAARESYGLPGRGPVTNGSVKTGVVGKSGGGGGPARGGSGVGEMDRLVRWLFRRDVTFFLLAAALLLVLTVWGL